MTPIDAATRHQIYLGRYSTSVANRLIALLNAVDKRLVAQIEEVIRDAPESFSARRIDQLLKSVNNELKSMYLEVGNELQASLRSFSANETSFALALLNHATQGAKVATRFAAVSPTTVYAAAMARPFQGVLLREALAGIEAGVAKRIRDTIRMGIVEGQTQAQIVRAIRGTKANGYADGLLNWPKRNIDSLVRTSVNHTSDVARQLTYAANSEFLRGWMFVATLDGRTSLTCASLSGKVFPIGSGPTPPRHWNCLPGDSLVLPRSRVTGAFKRWFDGEVIVIKTAGGRRLTSTPNHPILTGSGWIASGCINVGSNVVCDGGSEWGGIADGNHKDMPASIEHVAGAYLASRKVLPVPVPLTAKDFHGDGAGSKVAIVATDSLLGDCFDAALGEHDSEVALVGRCLPVATQFIGGSHHFESIGSGRHASDSCVGGSDEILSVFDAGVLHTDGLLFVPVSSGDAMLSKNGFDAFDGKPSSLIDAVNADSAFKYGNDVLFRSASFVDAPEYGGLTETSGGIKSVLGNDSVNHLVGDASLLGKTSDCASGFKGGDDVFNVGLDLASANLDSMPLQKGRDGVGADADLAANILGGSSCNVFLDDVISVERVAYSGHVYNLETVDGWYSANGIVTHNCRSTSIPLLKGQTELPGKRASKDGPVDANLTFSDWLKGQPTAVQDDILGARRAELFRQNKITVDRFTDARGKVLTLEQLKKQDKALFAQ